MRSFPRSLGFHEILPVGFPGELQIMLNSKKYITRRSKIQIMTEILMLSCKSNPSRNDLVSTVKVNYHQADYYLKWLERQNLLLAFTDNNRRKRYSLTPQGKHFLSIIDSIIGLLGSHESSKSIRFF